jgi:surface antigen
MGTLAQEWRILVVGSVLTALAPVALSAAHATPNSHASAKAPAAGKNLKSGLPASGGLKGPTFSGPGKMVLHSARDGSPVVFHSGGTSGGAKYAKWRYASREYYGGESYNGGSLQCVPFARAASGIELKGNAAEWWYAAAGVYARGDRPEPGSVLSFRATGHMRLGHVAVVSAVVNSREIEVDQANWAGAGAYAGGVARGVHVIDASPGNDWTAVRVALGNGDYGSVYPTHGFIYDRTDDGVMYAGAGAHDDAEATPTEVAEAPSEPRASHSSVRYHKTTPHQILKHPYAGGAKSR